MAAQVKPSRSRHKDALQGIILTAVYFKHNAAIHKAVEVIRDQRLDGRKPSKEGQKGGGLQLLDFLPWKNAQVDQDYRSHSPLMLACECELQDGVDTHQKGDIHRVRLLLDLGASAAFKNKEGLNALHIACNTGNPEICRLVLEKAKDQNHFGEKKSFTSDLPILVNAKEKRGWTPLMYAVQKDQLEIVTMLVDTGVLEFSKTNKKGATFLHLACGKGSINTLQYIIAHPRLVPKKMFTATDKKGWNILHYACCSGFEQDGQSYVQWLLETIPDEILSDADKSNLLTQNNEAGYSPLLVACEYQKVAAVKYLVGRSDVDVSDFVKENEGGKTGEKSALHLAAIHDSAVIAEILQKEGCKIDRIDSRGNTVLHVAKRKSSEQVERVILETAAGQKLLEEKNLSDQLPRDVKPKDIIPPEIVKRGPIFVERYKQALRQGKEKIPRCGLLFLGQARKGKTSLYKLIVGKEFDPEQDSTRGIDNNEVDTVDSRAVTMNSAWSEKSAVDQQRERDESHALAVLRELPDDEQHDRSFKFQQKTEEELLSSIEGINLDIKAHYKRKPKRAKLQNLFLIDDDDDDDDDNGDDFFDDLDDDFLEPDPITTKAPATKPAQSVSTTVEPKKKESSPKSSPKPREPKVPHPKKAVSDPLPEPSEAEPPAPAQLELIVSYSRTEAQNVNKVLKEGKKFKKNRKEPSLLLNVLDFAGQKNYRPMHHCFIRRRSMYIVVFNLQDMCKCIQQADSCKSLPSPVEEIRYWLHSIHAHIYPPESKDRGIDERQRRVVLVGTHQNPGQGGREVTEDDFQQINKLLAKEIVDDVRCVDHLCEVSGRWFIPVENSLKDPSKSGARVLQNTLREIKNGLHFLEESYPLPWLRLEGRLIEMKKTPNQKKCLPEKEVVEIAESKGVSNPDDALEFFHDIGEIVLLRRVSKLFLSEEEAESISDLVVIDPKWLIGIMQIIMELPANYKSITGKEQQMLRRGEISLDVLEQLWGDPEHGILNSSAVKAEKLAVVLQAYCLIHSAISSDSEDSSGKLFIIPSMLPLTDTEKIAPSRLPWIVFYFDFRRFLPVEVYHRLVCMLMAATQRTGSQRPYTLSHSLCDFDRVHNCRMMVELEALQHRIKISVIVSGEKLKPSECIKLVHDKYLKRICQESSLQGLKYYGGPMLKCRCSQPSVFTFVTFDISEKGDSDDLTIECLQCLKQCKDNEMDDEMKSLAAREIQSDDQPMTSGPQQTFASKTDVTKSSLSSTPGDGLPSTADSATIKVTAPPLTTSSPHSSYSGTGERQTVTIEELKKHTKVTDSQLDTKIEDKCIISISECFENVDDYVMLLKLNPGQETDVKDLCHRSESTKTAMIKALKLWREPHPYTATYGALVKILLEANKGNIADKICQFCAKL